MDGTGRQETAMDRNTVLDTAKTLINQDRKEDYGSAKESFGRIATMWTEYTGFPICDKDVAIMMVLLKVCRTTSSPQKSDSYVDMAGYAALAAELVNAEV